MRRTGEQAVVANAMEPAWQNVKQEAADELVDAERHDLLAVRAIAAIVLVAEGDAGRVESEQPPVRDGDAVGIARELGEHGFGTGEGRLGVDHPAFMADRRPLIARLTEADERHFVNKAVWQAHLGRLAIAPSSEAGVAVIQDPV